MPRLPSDTAQHCKPIFFSDAVRRAELRAVTLLISSKFETHVNSEHLQALQIWSGSMEKLDESPEAIWHWFVDEGIVFFICLVASLNTATQASW